MAALAEFVTESSGVMPQGSKIVEPHRYLWAGLPLPLILRPAAPLSDPELIAFSRRNRPFRIEINANGELAIMSPLGGRGARGELKLIGKMDLWAEEHGGESFSSNAGFRLKDGSVRCPDAAWVASDRWNALSDAEQTTFPPLCPDFVIELASASDSRADVKAKMEMWMANGAKLGWMIDPFAADVTIYRPGLAPARIIRPTVVEADTIVPGFRLPVLHFWEK